LSSRGAPPWKGDVVISVVGGNAEIATSFGGRTRNDRKKGYNEERECHPSIRTSSDCSNNTVSVILRGNLLPIMSSFAIIGMLFFHRLPSESFKEQNHNESRPDL
jgi:hypothetical protein